MSQTPRSLRAFGGGQRLRNYPEATSIAGHNVDEHTSPVEEDSILYLNLQLMDFPDALAQWPDFKDISCAISEDMFTRPNKKALYVVLYFLFSQLLGRDATRRYFKKCWPITLEPGNERDFKLRAVEWIKTYGTEWEIPKDRLACVPSMLQRHAGLKLVELLCCMSHMALLRLFERSFPEKRDLVASMRDPLAGMRFELDGSGDSEELAGLGIATRKSKVSILQKRFMELVGVMKANQACHEIAVGKILEEHATMSKDAEESTRKTNLVREMLEGDVSPQKQRNLSKLTKELESSVAQVADFGVYLDRVVNEPWDDAHRISRETLGVEEETENGGDAGNVERRRRRASNAHAQSWGRSLPEEDSDDMPFTSLVSLMMPNMEQIQEMTNVSLEATRESALGLHNRSDSNPQLESPVHDRATAQRDVKALFGGAGLGLAGLGKQNNMENGGGGEDEDAAPVAVLTDVIEGWQKSLKDLQNSLAPLQSSRLHRNLMREVLGTSPTGAGEKKTHEFLGKNVECLDVLTQGLVDEGDRLDEEIDRLRGQLGPLNQEVLARLPCEADFVVRTDYVEGS
ncbi:hypothetical protein BSKO_12842 [Bryopsis sp. KO-2023]|nr:hypothetical protein BSKO_12842 [Bryopsis sp. KO-2023]